ncbi:hypothetical protein CS8_092210 [Cupriavidus sp. 8B]
MQVLPVAQDRPVPGDSRHAGHGADAGRHPALLARKADLYYMGTSTFDNHIVVPESALAKMR